MAALAACLLAASTAPAIGVDDSPAASALPSKPVITPVRVAQGVNFGDLCERYYPLSSRAAHESGSPVLLLYVDADGLVKATRIEESSGYIALDEAAERCFMEEGRFVPQTIDSAPVASWQRVKLNWRLTGPGLSHAGDALRSSFVRGDYATTVKLLIPYAHAGSIDAQVMLARMYLNGMGVSADAGEAAAWMRKAAEQGSTVAAYEFGVLSENGMGCPRDYPAAAYWFRKAAHQRQPDAAFNLALLYQSGLGVERDSAMALLWINAAIEFLAPSGAEAVGPSYASTRNSILAGMSPEQADAASRITSPDGPVIRGFLRNRAAVEKAARAAYPANRGEHSGVRTVVLLAFVLADGHVGETRVETSSGLPRLDAATEQVLSQGEIVPKIIGGRSVDAWQTVTWTWALH